MSKGHELVCPTKPQAPIFSALIMFNVLFLLLLQSQSIFGVLAAAEPPGFILKESQCVTCGRVIGVYSIYNL